MDGLEACLRISRRKGGHPIPPVIFVAANVSSSFEAECTRADVHGLKARAYAILYFRLRRKVDWFHAQKSHGAVSVSERITLVRAFRPSERRCASSQTYNVTLV
jgi:CheY-like chemotaxis protein